MHAKKVTLSGIVCFMLAACAAWADGDLRPSLRAGLDQDDLNQLVAAGDMAAAVRLAQETGRRIAMEPFDLDAGVGANVGDGSMFTRLPRADLTGDRAWASHVPHRETGVNATTCLSCHGVPIAMGAGELADNILADPGHTGDQSQFLTRNPPSLIALGIPQRLAEEIAEDLSSQRETARLAACRDGVAEVQLTSKGVDYGRLTLTRIAASPCTVEIDTSEVDGLSPDLIPRPFGWKGTQSAIRVFVRNAAHNELGLQGTELVGATDGDFDGVTDELSVGDITALTVFLATLPRPVSTVELADVGLMEMDDATRSRIASGESLFSDIGCAQCHVPAMTLETPILTEPAATSGFHDATFPNGSDPALVGLMQQYALQIDLSLDQAGNNVRLDGGGIYNMGALEIDARGQAVARWYTDFKRHDMGPDLADPADPLGLGASVFATRSLAGVGSTGPWLHDGRAMTLEEAVLAHGGAARPARLAYAELSASDQDAIIAFLDSLRLYSMPEQ